MIAPANNLGLLVSIVDLLTALRSLIETKTSTVMV